MKDTIERELKSLIPIRRITIDVKRIKSGGDEKEQYVDYPIQFVHPDTRFRHEVVIRITFPIFRMRIKNEKEYVELLPGVLHRVLYNQLAERLQ